MSPTLLLLPSALLLLGLSPPGQCPPDGEWAPVGLAEVWERGQAAEPGFRIHAELVAAGEADRSAVRRDWIPGFEAQGVWTYGQRTSPGEERVLGVGPRGDLRVLGSWTLLDASRSHRARQAQAGVGAAQVGGKAFDARWRGMAARSWNAALLAELRVLELDAHAQALEELGALVELRARAGVEADWEVRLLQEARARSEARRAEAWELRSARRAELAALVGACVRPDPLALPMEGPPEEAARLPGPAGSPPPMDGNPEVLRLRALGDAREAEARARFGADLWEVSLIGGVGPSRSRAFDPGPIEPEYLAGVSGRLRLDVGGSQRMNLRSGEAEARALQAEADGLQRALAREASGLEAELAERHRRRGALEEERTRADASLEAARLRWGAGVDGWYQVLQAQERALDAGLALAALDHDLLEARIRLAELAGGFEALLRWTEGSR